MSKDIDITAVVAMSENRCIGQDNDLPWHIPADLKHFKEKTLGKPIIMGRNTFESIYDRLGKPLPGRLNIVLTSRALDVEGVMTTTSLDDAIDMAQKAAAEKGLSEIIIGGGAQIYKLALPRTTKIHLTNVHAVVNGDAFFPELSADEWEETADELHEGEPSYSFKTFVRRA
jgi:dihydrofolate reductase